MQINGNGPLVTDPSRQAASTDQGSGGASAISADFDTFLQLLTTQLRSQDPLKPVASTEFVAQLASFSTVEQQARTNKLLEQLVAGLGPETGLSGLVSWIGMDVAAPGPASWDGAGTVSYMIEPPENADTAELTIYNDFGSPVARLQADPTARQVTWNGITSSGEPAPPGAYTASVAYSTDGAPTTTRDALTFSRVREIRTQDGGPVLLLANGAQVSPADVAVVRTNDQGGS